MVEREPTVRGRERLYRRVGAIVSVVVVSWVGAVGCGPRGDCTFEQQIEKHAGSGATNCGRRTPGSDGIDYECVIREFREGESWYRVWERSSGPDVAKVGDGDRVVVLYGRGGGTVEQSHCKTPHVGREDVDPRATEENEIRTVTCDLYSKREKTCKKGRSVE